MWILAWHGKKGYAFNLAHTYAIQLEWVELDEDDRPTGRTGLAIYNASGRNFVPDGPLADQLREQIRTTPGLL